MADYDSASLSVDPMTIYTFTKALEAQAQDVVHTLTSVNDTLSALALSWAGRTADEVQQVNDNWTSVMTDLFGTQDNPQLGVVNVILGGLQQVCVGYSHTELQLVGVWQRFYDQLSKAAASTSTGVPTSAPPNVIDPASSAVFEVFHL